MSSELFFVGDRKAKNYHQQKTSWMVKQPVSKVGDVGCCVLHGLTHTHIKYGDSHPSTRITADDGVCPSSFILHLFFSDCSLFWWNTNFLFLCSEMHRNDPVAGGNTPRGKIPGDGLSQEAAGNPSPVVKAQTRSGSNRCFVLRGLGWKGIILTKKKKNRNLHRREIEGLPLPLKCANLCFCGVSRYIRPYRPLLLLLSFYYH